MKKILFLLEGLILLGILALLCSSSYAAQDSKQGFQIDTILLKTVIKTNGSYTGKIGITNLQETAKTFEASFVDLENVAFLKESNFILNSGETKNLEVIFSDINSTPNGIYIGSLEISSGEEKQLIPIILEIESKEVLFDSNTALFPTETISPGNQITAQIRIFDLSRIGTSNIEMTYFIKDFLDKGIIQETENLVVKDEVLVTKSIIIPKDTAKGNYVFAVVLKYKNSMGISSAVFRIEEPEEKSFLDSIFSDNKFYFIFFSLFIVIVLLIFFFFSVYSRDKLVDELRKQYERERRKQEQCLISKEKINLRKLKTKEEKKLNKKLFDKIRAEKSKAIKKIHEQRVSKLKHLKKHKKKNELQKQIEKWKKEGYNTSVLEKNIKLPSANDIKRQVNKWKKKGYKTKVLEEEIK